MLRNKKFFLLPATLFCLLNLLTLAQAETPVDHLHLLLKEALSHNLEIASLEEKTRALQLEAPSAGSLSDPRITLALVNLPTDSFSFRQENMTQKQLGIAQGLPWFGVLSLKEKNAELRARQQEELTRAKRLSVARDLKLAWYDLALVQEKLKSNEQIHKLVRQLLVVSETRYAAGKGLQQDVLFAQVQLSELQNDKISLGIERNSLQDRIGNLLDRDDLYRGTAPAYTLDDQLSLNQESLVAQSLERNPSVVSQKLAIIIAKNKVKLAEKAYMPNMDLRLAYGQRDSSDTMPRSDFVSAGITFTVPLWQSRRQDSQLGGSKRRVRSARYTLESLEKSLPHRVDGLVTVINESFKNYRLYSKGIEMQAEQLARASLAAYSVGSVEFLTMLNAEIKQEKVKLAAKRYLYKIYKKNAELEELVGQPVSIGREV
ncbi:TolC family protein [Desulfotalea psychrophila]|nr:TolC family protein [Desulfotalea psychrophila]